MKLSSSIRFFQSMKFMEFLDGACFHLSSHTKLASSVDVQPSHLWYWGPAVTASSLKIPLDHPSFYLKTCDPFWNFYNREEVVVVEGLDKLHCYLHHHLESWTDSSPLLAEGQRLRPNLSRRMLVVTSKYPPCDIWTDSSLSSMQRRFVVVHIP